MKQNRVKPEEKVDLSKWDPNDIGDFKGKQEGLAEVAKLDKELIRSRNCYMPSTSIRC